MLPRDFALRCAVMHGNVFQSIFAQTGPTVLLVIEMYQILVLRMALV